jgi:hypothetical protein
MGRVLRTIPGGTWMTVHLALETENSPPDREKTTLESRLPMRAFHALDLEIGITVALSLLHDGITVLPRDRESTVNSIPEALNVRGPEACL